jgi:cyclophilin family peptidyl-prolyl cis-trans isomerase
MREQGMFGSKKKQVDEATAGMDFGKNRYQLEFDTTHGPIKLDFWPDVAPQHCKNMLGLAKSGFYDGLTFHRVVPGFVIQGGCPNGNGTGGPGYKVDAEFNDNKHEAGVLSMARSSDPNSAGSQFFLCLAKVPYLDGQYTAFGKTADDASLKTVQKIGAVATGSQDKPLEPVVIKTAKVVEQPL